jgi:hypothetical protein
VTTTTARYALNKIVEATDNVDVVNDFNVNWDGIDLKLGTQVCTSSTRPASPVQGMLIYETDTTFVRVYKGSSWVDTSMASCLSSAFPANPITGDVVYTTDKNAVAVYTGSIWQWQSTVICTSSTRPTVALANGVDIYETDTKRVMVWNGSSWDNHSGALVCTSTTRPTAGAGMVVYETDTGKTTVYTGSAWVPTGAGGLMATPINSDASGTATSGSTETFDTVLGYYTCALINGRRYRVTLEGLDGNGTVVNDVFDLRVRNSGSASNPTATSTLVAENIYTTQLTGTSGRVGIPMTGTFQYTGTTGNSVFGFSAQRTAGTGTFTPVEVGTLGRTLYVEDMGAAF